MLFYMNVEYNKQQEPDGLKGFAYTKILKIKKIGRYL